MLEPLSAHALPGSKEHSEKGQGGGAAGAGRAQNVNVLVRQAKELPFNSTGKRAAIGEFFSRGVTWWGVLCREDEWCRIKRGKDRWTEGEGTD